MWWRTVLILNLLAIIQSIAQLESNGTKTAAPRCCPCPPGADVELAQPGLVDQTPQASGASPGRVEHCPCLARHADAEGAASVLFPNSEHASGNVVRPEPKEDAKPLLHPEVDLASSVLETLREATDEEYREALARDAARAAAPGVTLTVANDTPEENRNVVTIIVSPQDMEATDDTISEASHVQETRCIHSPLGNAKATFNYRAPHNGLNDVLNLPLPGGLLHKQRDSNQAVSHIHESVVQADSSLNSVLSGLRLKVHPSLFNLAPISKIGENKNNILSNQIEKKDSDGECLNNKNAFDISQRNLDSNSSPSNVQIQLVKANDREESSAENVAVFSSKKLNRIPLKNLFKLRDVELIPLDKMIPKSQLNIPNFKLDHFEKEAKDYSFNPVKLPKLFDLFGKPSKVKLNETIHNNDTNDLSDSEKSAHIQYIPNKTKVTTEILDAVPSPSEVDRVVSAKDTCLTFQPETEKLVDKESAEAGNLFDSSSIETLEPSVEQVSDSIVINEDFNNISDLNQPEDIESKSDEGIEDSESDGTGNIEIIDDSQGFDQGIENKITISQEDKSDVSPSSVDLSEINGVEERNNNIAEEDHPLKTLEAIRKSVVEKLDALQNNNRIAFDNIKNSVEEISEMGDAIKGTEGRELLANSEENFSASNSESSSLINVNADELKDVSTSTEQVSIQDLQNMSDSILIASEKDQQDVLTNNKETQEHKINSLQISQPEDDSKEVNSDSEEIRVSEIDKILGINKAGQLDREELKPENVKNEKNIMENTCIPDLRKKLGSEIIETSFPDTDKKPNINNDLESLASEPIINSILRPNSKSLTEHLSDFKSKLRQNLIVQPTSLINKDDLSIFKTPALSIPDISELNANIPSIEEIRAKVSEILGGLARHADDEEVSSELDCDDFASNLNPVISARTDSVSPFSLLQSRKDLNLDIIQLKPLPVISGTNLLKTEFPGFNLNTYKAKLAVPRTLDLKPLKLASTLGNEGGLVGATLSIEPEKKIKIGRSNFRNPDHSSLVNYPVLADITASVQKNAQNLNIPKVARGQTLQANNAIRNIADNLKYHTESTLKNIHQTLNSPFIEELHTNLKETANHQLNPGRNALDTLRARTPVSKLQSCGPINAAEDNLNAQSENTFRIIKPTINTPSLAISNSIRSQKTLENSIPPLDSVVNNLRSQTGSVMKNIQQTLKVPDLSHINNSVQKTTQTAVLRSSLQPIVPLDTVVDNVKSQTQSTIRNIQKSLSIPTLSDISATGRSTLGQVFQGGIPIDLKPHGNKAVKDLQRTFKASLRNSPIKYLQPLTNPNHVIQMITDHQEDVNDKLFAIHTDLTDRLESMHNDIMDPDRLKSILSPPRNRHFELFSIPLPSSRMTAPQVNKQTKPVFKNKQPSLLTQKKEFRKSSVPKVSKPKSGVTKLVLMPASTDKERKSPKSFKIASAASAPALVHTYRPILPIIPKKPILSKSLKKDSLKKPVSRPNLPKSLQAEKKPILTQVAKSTMIVTTTAKPKISDRKRLKPKPPVRQPTPWNGWGETKSAIKLTQVGDLQTSLSHVVPKAQSPMKSNSLTAINEPIKTELLPRLGSLSSRLKPESLKKSKPNTKLSTTREKTSNPDSQLVTKPKNSLLSKLTETLKNRQAKANLSLPAERSSLDLDTGTAPSEHVENAVAFGEPIKENISYKCKMVCVKIDNLQD